MPPAKASVAPDGSEPDPESVPPPVNESVPVCWWRLAIDVVTGTEMVVVPVPDE